MRLPPRVLPLARSAGIGLLVGGVFLAFAGDRIERWYRGNPSGLLHISERRFDLNPLVNERPDLRRELSLESTDGYDGQYFYFMAFDPLVTRYQHRPRSYSRVLDSGPYRFGRIGFSWLTRLVSAGRESWYPVAMIALVLGSLGICGALLSRLAQQHGLSAWYGALILAIPGFWQSAVLTLPEPLTLAFILAGLLSASRDRWLLAGASLGMAMLIRETSGAVVLAVPAALFLAGRRRESVVVALLAFLPVVLWKTYLGWIFFPVEGIRAFFPRPDDVGLPFKGIWHLWTEVAQGTSTDGLVAQRSGVAFSVLTIAAAALALAAFLRRPAPMTAAALFYGLLATTFNYEAVWSYTPNAQRLAIDLFAALTLAFLQPADSRRLPRAFAVFWSAMALYVLFGTTESADVRRVLFGWIW